MGGWCSIRLGNMGGEDNCVKLRIAIVDGVKSNHGWMVKDKGSNHGQMVEDKAIMEGIYG